MKTELHKNTPSFHDTLTSDEIRKLKEFLKILK